MNYKIAEAVRTGRYHAESDQPCQDRIQVKRADGLFCAAVADGAGSRADSQIGAECAVTYVVETICEQFEDFWEQLEAEIARLIVDGCLAVLARQEPPIYNLASTLLFFAAHEDGRFLSGNLGDGVQIWKNGETLSVLSCPENGEYQNQTVFLTSENAAEHLRVIKGNLSAPGGLLMMSDGMAESLYQRDTSTPAHACATLIGWLEEGDEDVIAEAIGNNMDDSFSKRSGDDLSLVVIAWNDERISADTASEDDTPD